MSVIPTDIDFLSYLGDLEKGYVEWAVRWRQELAERIQHGYEAWGATLPWRKTETTTRLRPGELTIWGGINGHRKSMMVGQVMVHLARTQKVCIASLEMEPVSTLERMVYQAAGCKPGQEFVGKFADWTENRICIYDQLDTVGADRILGMVHYAAKELGCDHVVIDSLMKCGLGADDYNMQKRFVDRLQWAAKTLKTHVHLVAHVRKGQDEGRRPNKFDVSGSSDITNIADNVFICWKNKRKEDAKNNQSFGLPLTDSEEDALNEPCQELHVVKQRHGRWEGHYDLWFDDASMQFLAGESVKPSFLEFAA